MNEDTKAINVRISNEQFRSLRKAANAFAEEHDGDARRQQPGSCATDILLAVLDPEHIATIGADLLSAFVVRYNKAAKAKAKAVEVPTEA